jgi:hypothetical protein
LALPGAQNALAFCILRLKENKKRREEKRREEKRREEKRREEKRREEKRREKNANFARNRAHRAETTSW